MRSALTHAQDNQLPESLQQQLLQHGKAPPYRQRVVAWQATDSSTEDEDTAIYSSEARIEVTAKCRPKEGEQICTRRTSFTVFLIYYVVFL